MEPKPWYKSKTIIGAFVVLVSTVLREFGIEIGDLDESVVSLLLDGVGIGIVIYGRVRARRPIAPPAVPAEVSLFLLAVFFSLLVGCAGMRIVGSLSAEHEGQTLTVSSDGRTVRGDIRLSNPRGYAK